MDDECGGSDNEPEDEDNGAIPCPREDKDTPVEIPLSRKKTPPPSPRPPITVETQHVAAYFDTALMAETIDSYMVEGMSRQQCEAQLLILFDHLQKLPEFFEVIERTPANFNMQAVDWHVVVQHLLSKHQLRATIERTVVPLIERLDVDQRLHRTKNVVHLVYDTVPIGIKVEGMLDDGHPACLVCAGMLDLNGPANPVRFTNEALRDTGTQVTDSHMIILRLCANCQQMMPAHASA